MYLKRHMFALILCQREILKCRVPCRCPPAVYTVVLPLGVSSPRKCLLILSLGDHLLCPKEEDAVRGDIVRIVPLNVREVEGFDVPVFDRNRVVLVWFQVFLQPLLKAHIDKFQRRFPGFLALNALIVLCGDRDLLFLLPPVCFSNAESVPGFRAENLGSAENQVQRRVNASAKSKSLKCRFGAGLLRRSVGQLLQSLATQRQTD